MWMGERLLRGAPWNDRLVAYSGLYDGLLPLKRGACRRQRRRLAVVIRPSRNYHQAVSLESGWLGVIVHVSSPPI
jgi:hypothetical protein